MDTELLTCPPSLKIVSVWILTNGSNGESSKNSFSEERPTWKQSDLVRNGSSEKSMEILKRRTNVIFKGQNNPFC